MKFIILVVVVLCSLAAGALADGNAIVAAARAQAGAPYIFAGGDTHGRTKGGFDCSGLSLYAVFKGTGKVLPHSATAQYNSHLCKHVPFGQHLPGDLIFYQYGGSIEHVTIATGPNTLIHAPKEGDHVREATIWASGRMNTVTRCF